MPVPDAFYSSPQRRCLQTLALSSTLILQQSPYPRPIIKENLRGRYGKHTCDQRSSKSWISRSYPTFSTEPGFTELDELRVPEQRESPEEQAVRTRMVLDDIFSNENATFVSLTTHPDVLRAFRTMAGLPSVCSTISTIYPLVMVGERVS